MAETVAPLFDTSRYPILERKVGTRGDKSLVYLDSAATALVSDDVLGVHDRFLRASCANIHRGAHTLAEEATDGFESAREQVAAFFGVADPERVVFTHGATEALNLAARGWGDANLREGDVIAVAEDNHHSNIVPWQMLAERTGAQIAWVALAPDGLIDEATWTAALERAPKLVALCHQSNVLGFRQPRLAAMMEEARAAGALVALDGAQAAGHEPVDVDALGADFYACSAHKMGGLTGIGALMCSPRGFTALEPCFGGGGMAAQVNREGWRAVEGAAGFEAGTPPIAAAIAWSAALDGLEACGLEALAAHTRALAEDARERLSALEGVRVLGGASGLPFESLVSFSVEGVHPHDVGQALDAVGVMVRAGHHCAKPVHAALGERASVRASFGGYSQTCDVDALVGAVGELVGRKEN